MRRVGVFLGSATGFEPKYAEAAQQLGMRLGQRGIGLVYGGGSVGLMGVVADAALAAGGTVIGVLPDRLATKELAHGGLTDLRIVRSMHERKALMEELSDAFVALPGGMGTLDEFCEILTWGQLGIHQKPCGLLNVAGYFDMFLRQLDHAVREGFLKPKHCDLVLVETDIDRLMELLESRVPRPTAGTTKPDSDPSGETSSRNPQAPEP